MLKKFYYFRFILIIFGNKDNKRLKFDSMLLFDAVLNIFDGLNFGTKINQQL